MLSERAKKFSVRELLKKDQGTEDTRSRLTNESYSEEALSNGCQRVDSGVPCYHSAVQTKTDSSTGRQIRAELCHAGLWQSFHHLGTEMIVTKTGRRMFPALRVKFDGLHPDRSYRVSLYFVPVDQNKYRYIYHSSKWMVAGPGDSMLPDQMYEHSDSPIEGIHLVNQVVSFERIKLTNSTCPKDGQISLVSMQKFQPRIQIVEVCSHSPVTSSGECSDGVVFSFPQTSFMAVTAYQNQEITRLKIARNPFAKGFRDAGKTRSSLDAIMSSFGYTLPRKLLKLDPCAEQRVKSEPNDHYYKESYIQQTTQQQVSLSPNMYNFPSDTTGHQLVSVNGMFSGSAFYRHDRIALDSFACGRHIGESSPVCSKNDPDMSVFYSPIDMTQHNLNVAETFFDSSSIRKCRSTDDVSLLKSNLDVSNSDLSKIAESKNEGHLETRKIVLAP